MGREKRFVVAVVAAALVSVPIVAGAVGGFAGPVFGLSTAPNGKVIAADAGAGLVFLRDDTVVDSISLPGATDADPIGKSSLWATTGAGEDPTVDSGQALHRVSKGKSKLVVNLFEFEKENNPDGKEPFDTNPFDVESLGGNAALVADAGANALLRSDKRGDVEVVAVFPDEVVSTENFRELCGEGPECDVPDFLPAEPVPTSIAVGPDDHIYVGELKGFPAPVDESNIWRISPDARNAECGSSPDCVKVFDGGFTSIIDLVFGPDGRLYVAEMDELSWAAVEIFGNGVGGTVNACDLDALDCEEVATEIPQLTAMTFDRDDDLWVTRNVLVPGGAEVTELP